MEILFEKNFGSPVNKKCTLYAKWMFRKMFLFYMDIREYYKAYHTNLASTEDQFTYTVEVYEV